MGEAAAGMLSGAAFDGLRPLRASAAVRARICLAIEHGLLGVGDRLPDHQATARALDVSTMTLRRVLAELTEEGVLERRPGRGGGTFVASADPALWRDDEAVRGFWQRSGTVLRLIERRALIESSLAAEASARAESAAPELAAARAAVEAAAAAPDWAAFHEADRGFHRAIAEAAGLPWALAEHSHVAEELYGYFVPYPLAYLRESNEQHRAALEAIEAGDTAAALRLSREHVLELKDSMFIASHPLGSRAG